MECRKGVDEVAVDALGVDSKLHKPIEARIECPKVPYIGAIYDCFEPGRMVILHGTAKPLATRITFNLCYCTATNDDIVLHVNPRFNHKYVVRNSRIAGRWGEEEDSVAQRYPFRRGDKFVMVVFVTEEQFMISVNGRHFCSYRYRMPLSRINTLEVSGDLDIELIEHRRATIYPEPSPQRLLLYKHIGTERLGVDDISPFEPPYIGLLPGTFEVGNELEILGKVKLLPHSFYVNLQQGQHNWPHPLILLHLTPRFLVTSDTVTGVVYNSWLDGRWGVEERSKALPFHPGTPFLLTVRCAAECYTVSVNGSLVASYKHRAAPELADTVCIEGDVWISDIRVKTS